MFSSSPVHRPVCAAILATAVLTGSAIAAHDTDDLAAIDSHLQSRLADSTIPARLRKPYKALAKRVRRRNPHDLVSQEVAKMQAAAAAATGKLRDDRTLPVLLEECLQRASD